MSSFSSGVVTVYSKPNCPQCTMTYRQMDRRGIRYDVVDVTQDSTALEYVRGLGYKAAPVVVVSDDEHWSGFSPDRIDALALAVAA